MSDRSLPAARSPAAVADRVAAWRAEGLQVGFVPTMGALHAGHLSLVRIAKARADRVVASVFVNPRQFAPGEDFAAYPRDEARDSGLLAETGCDLLYAPPVEAMYPEGAATTIVTAGPAEGLESAARPHFFHGVATVVAKLFNQVRPDVAVFGEKDYQQLQVIRRLVIDLDLGVEILAGPTERDPDGLAMSSRNAYLDAAARAKAPALFAALARAAADLAAGTAPTAAEAAATAALRQAGFDPVDYVAVRDADTLAAVETPTSGQALRVLGAARLGPVRLIDNLAAVAG